MGALALRQGKSWTVVITDGAESTANKRAAAVGVIEASLRPAGAVRETFALAARPIACTPERIQALRDFVAQIRQGTGRPRQRRDRALIDHEAARSSTSAATASRELGGSRTPSTPTPSS